MRVVYVLFCKVADSYDELVEVFEDGITAMNVMWMLNEWSTKEYANRFNGLGSMTGGEYLNRTPYEPRPWCVAPMKVR